MANLLDKKSVHYRKGDDTESCGECIHFLPPSSCELVAGTISAQADCDLFEPKPEQSQDENAPGGMEKLMSDLFGPENKEEQNEQ